MLGSVTPPGLEVEGEPVPRAESTVGWFRAVFRPGEGEVGAVLGVGGRPSLPPEFAYIRQRCLTLALSTETVLCSDSSCFPCSSSLPMSDLSANMSSRSLTTWSLSSACFWFSAFSATVSPRAWIWRMAWSAVAASAFCATSSPIRCICRERCSSLRTSARCATSSPSSCSWRPSCSTRAASAFCCCSSMTASIFFCSSSTLGPSARPCRSCCRILSRSCSWSACCRSTFRPRASASCCNWRWSCSARTRGAFVASSSPSCCSCFCCCSAFADSLFEARLTFMACSWSARWFRFTSVAFCSTVFPIARISRFRSSSRPSILSLTTPSAPSTCRSCEST
mmetsp:Transcript_7595/g.22269  ORF Transcript_7595/g.22269 Transcript_7595/m.22269 type:complete len:338 (+) Transcript_7595:200-1213(+)